MMQLFHIRLAAIVSSASSRRLTSVERRTVCTSSRMARCATVNRGGRLFHAAIALRDKWYSALVESDRGHCRAHGGDRGRGGRLPDRSELVAAHHRLHSRDWPLHRWALS